MTTNRSHIPLACSALLFLAGGGVSIRNEQDRRWIPNCKILPRILSVFSSQTTNISICMADKKTWKEEDLYYDDRFLQFLHDYMPQLTLIMGGL